MNGSEALVDLGGRLEVEVRRRVGRRSRLVTARHRPTSALVEVARQIAATSGQPTALHLQVVHGTEQTPASKQNITTLNTNLARDQDETVDRPEVRSHRLEVVRATEDGEQHGVGDEVEARERAALVVKVTDERLEADLELDVNMAQHDSLGHLFAVAALQHVARVVRPLHHLRPPLVDAREPLRLLRQFLRRFRKTEDGLQVLPQVLHFQPRLQHLAHLLQLLRPVGRLVTQRPDVSGRKHDAFQMIEITLVQYCRRTLK